MDTWDERALNLEAGRLCLEFANTANWHASPQPIEELTSYGELVAWAQKAGVLNPDEANALRRSAEENPGQADRTMRQAVGMREAIYRLFSAIAHGRSGAPEDIEAVNAAWQRATQELSLGRGASGFLWVWSSRFSLDRPLWPVALSAGSLLTSDQIARVGECADDRGCGWLFYDGSRNRSRRWCGMENCGNRAKARRHYQRTRLASAPG